MAGETGGRREGRWGGVLREGRTKMPAERLDLKAGQGRELRKIWEPSRVLKPELPERL